MLINQFKYGIKLYKFEIKKYCKLMQSKLLWNNLSDKIIVLKSNKSFKNKLLFIYINYCLYDVISLLYNKSIK